MPLIRLLVLAYLVCSCRTTAEHTPAEWNVSQQKADAAYEATVYAITDLLISATSVHELCEVGAKFMVDDPTHKCGVGILKNVCSLHIDYLKTASEQQILEKYLGDKPLSEQLNRTAKDVTRVTGPLVGRLRGAILECVQAATIEKVKVAATTLSVNQSDVYNTVMQNAASPATDTATGAAAGASVDMVKTGVWKRAVGYVACRGATAAIAASIDAVWHERDPNEHLYKECKTIAGEMKDWINRSSSWSSCTRSIGSACALASLRGAVNLENFLPTLESDSAKVAAQLGSAVASGVCLLGEQSTKLACSVISASAGQIKKAFETGNNDWARCLGVDRLGACIGSYLGADGWSNDNPVAQPRKSAAGTYKPCCWCHKEYFVNDGWFSDSKIKREHWLGVIQTGDVKTGNCHKMKRHSHNWGQTASGQKLYYKYAACQKAFVKGNVCSIPKEGNFSVWDPVGRRWQSFTQR